MIRIAVRLTPLLLLGHVLMCVAHLGGTTGYADIRIEGAKIRYSLMLSQLPARLSQSASGLSSEANLSALAEALSGSLKMDSQGGPCRAVTARGQPAPTDRLSVTLSVDYRCPASVHELTIRDDFFDMVGADLHILAKIDSAGGQASFAFANERREARFTFNGKNAATSRINSFFILGIEHILTGYDHLLFLAALLVSARTWTGALKVITAFTLAHSITLALAVLGVLTPPTRAVEATIALSIAWVAGCNLLGRSSERQRWGAGFVFGLVHGLGFSTILREMDLPSTGLAWLLLQFNLGVEAGQAAAAAVALAALSWIRRKVWHARVLQFVSAGILVIGIGLVIDRAFY